MGTTSTSGLISTVIVQHGHWWLVQPAEGSQIGRAVAPHPPRIVVGYVIKGSWRYLEHDWIAKEGSFVFEPPGEIHTLVVDQDNQNEQEMITFFNISAMLTMSIN